MKGQKVSMGEWLKPRREKAIPSQHPDMLYIGLEHIEAHTTKLIGFGYGATMKSTANRFYCGDVLYSRLRPYLNKVWQADRDGLCSSEFIVLPANDVIDAGFLRYRLNASDFVSFANSLIRHFGQMRLRQRWPTSVTNTQHIERQNQPDRRQVCNCFSDHRRRQRA